MKHLKTFENINMDEVSEDSVYLYQGDNNYKLIGKIKRFKSNDHFDFYDYFDNRDYENNSINGDINYNDYDSSLRLTIFPRHILNINLAPKEEEEKYNLAIAINKYNL